MVPPRLVRRIVLAPLLIVIAVAVVVLFPPLALLAVAFGLARGSRWGHSRSAAPPAPGQARVSRLGRLRALRLLSFALIWLVAETAALFMCLALWITSGFGGRLRTEPYQSRHYAIMEWYLGRLYGAAVSTLGLRIEVHEPDLTAGEQAARLARPDHRAEPPRRARRLPAARASPAHRLPPAAPDRHEGHAAAGSGAGCGDQPGAQRVHLPAAGGREDLHRADPAAGRRAWATTAHW